MRQNGERADPQGGPARDVKTPAKGSNAPSIRDFAVTMAEHGWHVFPCGTPTGDSHGHAPGRGGLVDCDRCKAEKAPRRGWRWKERNSADPAVVRDHWPADGPNIGIACGPSGLVVIDLDTAAHGRELPPRWRLPGVVEGADVFAHLLEQHGQGWPDTFTVATASGGTHLFFRAPAGRTIRNSAGKVGPMIDVRASGGYVVGAGSVVGGKAYEVVNDRPPAPLPDWLADLADPRPAPVPRDAGAIVGLLRHGRGDRYAEAALRRELEAVLTAAVGTRNTTMHRAAFNLGQLVAAGVLDRARVVTLLHQAGESIGLGDREVVATVASGLQAGARHPRRAS